jgi:hypothetical protein
MRVGVGLLGVKTANMLMKPQFSKSYVCLSEHISLYVVASSVVAGLTFKFHS